MARRNYNYEKRQKDLARKKKQEEKRQRRLERKKSQTDTEPDQVDSGDDSPEDSETD